MDMFDSAFLNHTQMIRKRSIIRVMALIYFVFTFILGINHIYTHQSISTISLVLLFNAFLSLGNIVLLANDKVSDQISSYFITIPLFFLMIYLVSTGGVANTGFLWIFVVPIVFLYLHGLKAGLKLLGIFLLSIIFILFVPNNLCLVTTYSFELRVRIILVFVLAILLASVYEYFNELLFKEIKIMTYTLDQIANEDQLTKIFNRRGILNFIELSKQKEISSYGIILCDIDYFKNFNDTYGHEAGDKVLIHIANLIKQTIRKIGVVARWGGEEFLIFVPHKNQEQTYQIAQQIRQNVISNPIKIDDKELQVTLSIGFVSTNQLDTNIDEIIKQADDYMYKAKQSGRDTIYPSLG
jgi:diguanylate cyclase (GGDEF)-like protein